MSTPSERRTSEARQRFTAVAFVIVAGVLVTLLVYGYSLVARKPLAFGAIIGPLVGLPLLAAFNLSRPNRPLLEDVPEPLGSALIDALGMDGYKKVTLRWGSAGAVASFPRPMVNWPHVVLPARVVRDLSPEAVL